MPNLTMGHEGHQFHGDGISLSWPKGGEREIVPGPDSPETLSLRVKQRIAEGQIRLTTEEPNRPAWIAPASRITGRTGARKRVVVEAPAVTHMPTVIVHEPAVVEEPVVVEVPVETAVPDKPRRITKKRRSTRGRRTSSRSGSTA